MLAVTCVVGQRDIPTLGPIWPCQHPNSEVCPEAVLWMCHSRGSPGHLCCGSKGQALLSERLVQEVTEDEQVIYGTRALGRKPARDDTA